MLAISKMVMEGSKATVVVMPREGEAMMRYSLSVALSSWEASWRADSGERMRFLPVPVRRKEERVRWGSMSILEPYEVWKNRFMPSGTEGCLTVSSRSKSETRMSGETTNKKGGDEEGDEEEEEKEGSTEMERVIETLRS